MDLRFAALEELRPGSAWADHCARVAPAYERWYFAEGDAARPSYLACGSALRAHMPELLPVWNQLVELAGGGDRVARMLSLYRPPAFMAGCSQLLWSRDEPALVRNYDYELDRCEGLLLHSAWTGAGVIASIDSLWGALDGMNEHGVAVSLAFGGRQVVGDGFGIPLILRYVLETCTQTSEAVAVLSRVPCHMCYTVGVIDRAGALATVFLNPDRDAQVVPHAVATNHQGAVEWPAHAQITGTVERHAELVRVLDDPSQRLDSLVDRFLAPPLYSRDHARRSGTLYTAAYYPGRGEVELHWPTVTWRQSFQRFAAQTMQVDL
ncbi:C45 family autoproteolytic acyltransferase/hydolase [Enhygromyxa salina]|uniref:Acyl-coenzyme A:6-aminopenicillanic acid acyl-transferase n=1 Tax=Enhygromyxa salina TaxID=215803 RepID=A0A2S9YC34_9BACT|nr:C45 family peptidase [Enhygromyxa salina]PRQ02688.1 Acyl-coenzyme A:6-aminopenicillanic acid acyl-transferase [Enhygromyxa salina]